MYINNKSDQLLLETIYIITFIQETQTCLEQIYN